MATMLMLRKRAAGPLTAILARNPNVRGLLLDPSPVLGAPASLRQVWLRRRSDAPKQGYKGVSRKPSETTGTSPPPMPAPETPPPVETSPSTPATPVLKVDPPPPAAGPGPASSSSFSSTTYLLGGAALLLGGGGAGYYWWETEKAKFGPGPVIPDQKGGADKSDGGNGGGLGRAVEAAGEEIAKPTGELARGVGEVVEQAKDVGNTVAEEGEKKVEEGKKAVGDATQAVVDEGNAAVEEGEKALEKGKTAVGDGANAVVDEGNAAVEEGGKMVEKGKTAMEDAARAVVDEGTAAVDKGEKVVERGRTAVEDAAKAVVDEGNAAVEEGEKVVEKGKTAVEGGAKAVVDEGRAAVEEGEKVVEKGEKVVEEGVSTGEERAKATVEQGESYLKEGEKKVEEAGEGVKEAVEGAASSVKEEATDVATSLEKAAKRPTQEAGSAGGEWGQPEDEFVLERSKETGTGSAPGSKGGRKDGSSPEQGASGGDGTGQVGAKEGGPAPSGNSALAGVAADLAHSAVDLLQGASHAVRDSAEKVALEADAAVHEASERVSQAAKWFTPPALVEAGHRDAVQRAPEPSGSSPAQGRPESSEKADKAAAEGGQDFSFRGVVEDLSHGFKTEGEREEALAREGGATGVGEQGGGRAKEGGLPGEVLDHIADLMDAVAHKARERQAQLDAKLYTDSFGAVQEEHTHQMKDAQVELMRYAQKASHLEEDLKRLREAYQQALADERKAAEERRSKELEQQAAEHESDLKEAKLVAEANRAAAIAQEEGKFIKTLTDIHLQVEALREAFYTKSEESRKSHGAHKLAMSVFALEDALSRGAPLKQELASLQAAAGGPGADPLVDAALQSLPAALPQEGAPTRAQLQARLASLAPSAKAMALMPPEGSGVVAYGLAKLVALLKVSEQGSTLEGGGAEASLAKAEFLLAAGKLAEAAQAVEEGMAGTKAEALVREWATEARNRAVAEQTLVLIQAHATALAAGLS